ncbi:MAG TPA: hypothetical protein VMU50_19630 [Polyangia bacterium]|nr:hypothetical protein [Polyangia bacterium]
MTGGIIFGVTYAIALVAALSASASEGSDNAWNAIPFAGPLIFAHKRTCSQCVDDIGTPLYGIMVSGSQVVGAAMLASAFIFQRPWVVPDPAQGTAIQGGIAFVPVANDKGAGLMAVGRF